VESSSVIDLDEDTFVGHNVYGVTAFVKYSVSGNAAWFYPTMVYIYHEGCLVVD
jgi:hypothetical protein